MTSADGAWHLGIGDPTPLGWLTVAGYLAAGTAACSAMAGLRAGTHGRRFWAIAAVALFLLGLNKQLDLQTALTDIGRVLAERDGWYAQRHRVQVAFIGAVAAAALLALAALGHAARPLSPGRATALGGLVFLGAFVLMRAASFHHVDAFLADTAFGLRWNWLLELGGIAVVLAGAVTERRHAAATTSRPC